MSTHPSSSSVISTGCRELVAAVDGIRYVIDAYQNIIDDAALSGRLAYLLSDVERTVSALVSAIRGGTK